MKHLLFLVLLFALVSCQNKKSKEADTSVPQVEGVISSVLKAGKVKIGLSSEISVKVGNSSSNSLSPQISMSSNELVFKSATNGCSFSSIPPQTICTYVFHFTPTTEGNKSITLNFYGESLIVTGEAIGGGRFSIFPNSWAIGEARAGERITKTFLIENTGTELIQTPFPVDTTRFTTSYTNCPELGLRPGEQCQIEIKFREIYSGLVSDKLEMKVNDSVRSSITYNADVYPGDPSGIISFRNCPIKLNVDDPLLQECEAIVTDEFGNAVSDGTLAQISTTNSILEVVDQTVLTQNGVALIKFKSGSTTGEASFTVSSSLALGAITIPYTSGPAVGEISLFPYNNILRANGANSVVLRTRPLLNVNGDVVDDGTEVEFEIFEGSGTFNDRSSVEKAYTVNGEAFIKYTASLSTGEVRFRMKSNPLYSGEGHLLGYGANGQNSITLVPSAPSGDFEINTSEPSIYYEFGDLEYPSTTSVVIGPAKDPQGNPVGAGTPIDVSLYNAVAHGGISEGRSVFTVTTGSDSLATFVVRGIGIKGPITITGTLNSKSVSKQIQSVGRETYRFKDSNNRLNLYKTNVNSIFSPSLEVPPFSANWFPYQGPTTAIEKNSGQFISQTNYSKKIFEVNYNFPFMSSNCIASVVDFFVWGPCTMEVHNSARGLIDRGGSDRSYSLFYGGELNVFRSNGNDLAGWLDFATTDSRAFGTNNIMYANTLYLKDSDIYYIYGGLSHDFDDSSLRINNKFGTYKYPSLLKNNLDSLSFEKFTNSQVPFPEGALFPGISEETPLGIFIYGGLKSVGSQMQSSSKVTLARAPIGPESVPIVFIEKGVVADPNFGMPQARFSPIVHYSSIYEKVYIIGGFAVNSQTGEWEYLDEIWSFEPTEEDREVQWFRVCKGCGLPSVSTSVVSAIIDAFVIDDGEEDNLDTIAEKTKVISDNLYNGKVIFDSATRKTHYFSDDKVFQLDLLSGISFEVSSFDIFGDQFVGDEIVYNEVTNRYLFYSRGDRDRTPGKVSVFDSLPGHKSALMVKMSLRDHAKEFARKLNIKVNAIAKASTVAGLSNVYGVQLYAYNFIEDQWILMSESNESSLFLMKDRPMEYLLEFKDGDVSSIDPREFINDDNEHFLMVTPKEEPGYQGTPFLSDGESSLYLEFVELTEGVF
jgi:hypothetical protein